MDVSEKRIYEFGAFRLDAAEYSLSRDGQIVPLTPKVFDTLLVLVENSGHVVDKEELYKRVWQEAFVEETNLTKNISILRKILTEGDRETTFIETVPKRGYRFVVPVLQSNGNGSKPVTTETTEVDIAPPMSSAGSFVSRIKTHKYVFASVLGVVALLIAGVVGFYKFAFQKKTGVSFASAQITRLTSSGNVIKAALSADGKWLAYVEGDGVYQSLWLKQVAVPTSSTQIIAPAAAGYTGVTISPDGNYVYYTMVERGGGTGTVYQIPVLGGPAKKLFKGIYGPVAFSPDGKQIAYYYWINDEDRLMVANKDGTGQRQLVSRRENEFLVYTFSAPSWSPDSKNILATVGTFTPEQAMTVAVVSPENGAITHFSKQKFKRIDDIAWLSDGRGILISATDQFGPTGPLTSNKIWQMSYPSGNSKKITNDLNSYSNMSLTADSNSLAAVQTETLGNLWIASMNQLGSSSPITSGTHLALYPSWAPDGKVVYALNSGGNFELYLHDPREGTSKQLTAHSGNNTYPAVSPDGRYVVFSSDRSGALCLWRIDIDGSNPKQLTNQTSHTPSFAPDGRTIVYISQNNMSTLSTVSIDGGETRQLTKGMATSPVFSPDGTRILCLYTEGQNSSYRISIIPANGGSPIKTFPELDGLTTPPRWTPDGKAILYGITRRRVTNFWMQPVDGGAPKQLTNFNSDLIHSFEVSRDGKQLVFSRGTRSSDVVLFSGIRQ